jgi:DNA polymerase-3 subunit epsilon
MGGTVTTAVQRSFEDMGAPLYEVPFCVLDLETTGGSAADCEITEIGGVRYEGGELTGTFQTLVNPGTEIPPFITVLTGITHAMVVEAPRIAEALPSFLEFIGDAVIVGHNVRFDLSFLNAAAMRLGYGRLPNRSVDTASLARRLVRTEVRNLKLATLAAHFRSPTRPNHRALEDARATAHVFWTLLERAGTLGVTHLDDLLQLPTARGAAHYSKIEMSDHLPRRPGVYMFRDRTGAVFYVGKAKNLRSRVRSYFYGDTRRTVANMMREMEAIDHQVCETELEAEVLELRLIAEHMPRYNRRSKPARSPHWVKLTGERYPRLSMVRRFRDDGCLYLGPFRNRRSAEAVVTALWDAIPIRRCSGPPGKRSAPCGFAQLGVALCPCDGSLPEATYREVADRLVAGVEHEPATLLEPIAGRMNDHAAAERFEEAAWCRDRIRALGRSLRRRRSWQAMQRAGMVVAESDAGEGAFIDRGRLVGAWRRSAPRLPLTVPGDEIDQVPPSVAVAEEAHLVWRWLTGPGVRVLHATGPLCLPTRPVPKAEELVDA